MDDPEKLPIDRQRHALEDDNNNENEADKGRMEEVEKRHHSIFLCQGSILLRVSVVFLWMWMHGR